MNCFFKHKAVVSTFFIFLSFSVSAEEYRAQHLVVSDLWSRPLPEVSANGAAYLTVHNMGTGSDRLKGAASEIAEKVEIHTHVNQDGLMKMMHLEQGAELPAGEIVAFEPGGLHVMLLGLKTPLKVDTEYNLTLQFESAGNLEVVVKVEDRASSGMDHMSHMKHEEEGTTGHTGSMQQSD